MKRFILTNDCHLQVEKDGVQLFGMDCKAGTKFYGTMSKSAIQGFDLHLAEGVLISQIRPGILRVC